MEFTREGKIIIYILKLEAMNSVVNMDPKLVEKFKEDFGGVTYVPNGLNWFYKICGIYIYKLISLYPQISEANLILW